jgi:hypothetical protein
MLAFTGTDLKDKPHDDDDNGRISEDKMKDRTSVGTREQLTSQ